uniref:Uncharacterized protein n=1 Tax=Anguilla anguilla TaxID=7936 RepID=A0A0E9UVH4_ANGAN
MGQPNAFNYQRPEIMKEEKKKE